jgi:APA family basic amino acid/polyamine antiporter
MFAISSVYVLRWKRPDLPRPFRTPGYPFTPAVYLLLTAILALATLYEKTEASIYAVLSILAGIPFYYLWREKSRLLDAVRRIPKLMSHKIE